MYYYLSSTNITNKNMSIKGIALTGKQKYDKWNNDPDYSEAGSRRRVKKSIGHQTPFVDKNVAKELWKSKRSQRSHIDVE